MIVSWEEDGLQETVTLSISRADPIPPIPGRTTPGRQMFFISGFPRLDPADPGSRFGFPDCASPEARANLFRISVSGSDGSSSVACQEVLRSWPLANGAALCCRPADGAPGECEEAIFTATAAAGLDCARSAEANEAICGIVITGGNGGPSASEIQVVIDGSPEPTLRFVFDDLAAAGDVSAIKCFESFVPVDGERDVEVSLFASLRRDKALSTNWIDPVSQLTFARIDGSFVGVNPNVFLTQVDPLFSDRPPIPEQTCSTRSSCDPAAGGALFHRGDANADGGTDLSDGVFVLLFLFAAGEEPPCEDAMDIDDSGDINISDAIDLFNFLFLGSGDPPPPFGDLCGPDPTEDELGCEESFAASGLCN
jgi:hypothetical protein